MTSCVLEFGKEESRGSFTATDCSCSINMAEQSLGKNHLSNVWKASKLLFVRKVNCWEGTKGRYYANIIHTFYIRYRNKEQLFIHLIISIFPNQKCNVSFDTCSVRWTGQLKQTPIKHGQHVWWLLAESTSFVSASASFCAVSAQQKMY